MPAATATMCCPLPPRQGRAREVFPLQDRALPLRPARPVRADRQDAPAARRPCHRGPCCRPGSCALRDRLRTALLPGSGCHERVQDLHTGACEVRCIARDHGDDYYAHSPLNDPQRGPLRVRCACAVAARGIPGPFMQGRPIATGAALPHATPWWGCACSEKLTEPAPAAGLGVQPTAQPPVQRVGDRLRSQVRQSPSPVGGERCGQAFEDHRIALRVRGERALEHRIDRGRALGTAAHDAFIEPDLVAQRGVSDAVAPRTDRTVRPAGQAGRRGTTDV